jgi:hypothetical protein
MALVYVNPCSIGMGKKRKRKKGRKIKRNKKRRKNKGKKIIDFSLFFLGFFFVYLGSLKKQRRK